MLCRCDDPARWSVSRSWRASSRQNLRLAGFRVVSLNFALEPATRTADESDRLSPPCPQRWGRAGPWVEGNTFPASRSVGKVRLVWSSACMLGLLQGRGRGRGSTPTAVDAPDSVCPRASRCDVPESFSTLNVLALLALGGYAGIPDAGILDASVRAVREATGRAFETAGAARARREAVVGACEVAAARAAAIVAAKVERTFAVELIVLPPLGDLSSSSVTKRLGFSSLLSRFRFHQGRHLLLRSPLKHFGSLASEASASELGTNRKFALRSDGASHP